MAGEWSLASKGHALNTYYALINFLYFTRDATTIIYSPYACTLKFHLACFCVSVPVLSENTYLTCPKSSFIFKLHGNVQWNGYHDLENNNDMRNVKCNFGSSSSLIFSLFKDMVNLDLQVAHFIIFCFSFFVLALIQLELYIVLVMFSLM